MEKIFIIIPSFNEADNISFVTKKIDEGLNRYFPEYCSFIINVDSNSSDNTIKQFKSTITKSDKISLKCPKGKIGKGYGVSIGLKYGIAKKGKYFATIDADLKSIDTDWLNKLLKPITVENVDYVVPIYLRNRYEGNATNHFSSPIVYACFGYDLVQPIAGDFALSKRLVEKILDNFFIDSDYLYGVDSLISLTALFKNYNIKQQLLPRKIHNPSFDKIIPIFIGGACSTFYLINKHRKKILKFIKTRKPEAFYSRGIADENYIAKPSTDKINTLYNFVIKDIRKYSYKKIVGTEYVNIWQGKRLSMDKNLWMDILTDYLDKILEHDLKHEDILFLTQSILPLYLLRVLTYFSEIDNKTSQEIDSIIKMQKKEIRSILLKKLNL